MTWNFISFHLLWPW